jgi:hypothetical protein
LIIIDDKDEAVNDEIDCVVGSVDERFSLIDNDNNDVGDIDVDDVGDIDIDDVDVGWL